MPPVISVALLPKLLPSDWGRSGPIAVVIDTLRFTTTACVALAAGARAISVVSDIERAKQLARSSPGRWLLCGERQCVRIPGFDLGNSPSEYTDASIAGSQLIFSTTNGTVAVEAAAPAREIILASLINRSAVCHWLDKATARAGAGQAGAGQAVQSVWCVCAGTDGQVAYEDVLTAGAIIERLTSQGDRWRLGNDACLLALEAWKGIAVPKDVAADALPMNAEHADAESPDAALKGPPVWSGRNAAALVDRLALTAGGRNLIEAGFAGDLTAVARVDTVATVPYQYSPGCFQSFSIPAGFSIPQGSPPLAGG